MLGRWQLACLCYLEQTRSLDLVLTHFLPESQHLLQRLFTSLRGKDYKHLDSQLLKRLDKLDERTDHLVVLVTRYEERLAMGNGKFERSEMRLDGLEGRMIETENTLAGISGRNLIFERATWILFSAAVALLFKYGA